MQTNNKDTKVSYTKGEWIKKGLSVEVFGRGIIANVIRPKEGGTFECSANAKLIAAAPDLLEATKWLLYYVKITGKHLGSNAIAYAENAIKKATEQ